MEWQQIIGFYHVARLGSFTRAAEATFRTQSALTHQVKALETDLDCLLFERIGKRKILLTSAGKRLFAFAEALIEKYDYLLEDLNEIREVKKGHLKIAAPFTTLYHLLPVPIKRYTKQFPWVELTILDRSQQNVLHLVREGDIDFGIILESLAPKELASVRWKKTLTALIVAKGHPLTKEKPVSMDKIVRYPLILPPMGAGSHGRRRLDDLFSKLGLEYNVVMETSNVELSSAYCEMGFGVSFATIVKDIPARTGKNLVFIPLTDYFKPEYLVVVMRKDKILSPFKQAFLDLLS
ncbi:MAG: LysR family transcriptional regulator [Nitrospirae bacterium]|nr:LysR family transcriptional regulator [Nitrospirota bacterium]